MSESHESVPPLRPGPPSPFDDHHDAWGPALGQRIEASSLVEASQRIEGVLAGFKPQLGGDFVSYGNHVRRVFGLVRAQNPALSTEQLEQVAIAAVFHDIAVWVDGTWDYLEPSRDLAAQYLDAEGLASWVPEVSALILKHHKLRPVKDEPLVEAFRRADLCDLTFGRVSRGIPNGAWADLRAMFPMAGFHLVLAKAGGRWALKHPLRPAPMMRW